MKRKRTDVTRELQNRIFTRNVTFTINEKYHWKEKIIIHEKTEDRALILSEEYIKMKVNESNVDRIDREDILTDGEQSNSFTPKVHGVITYISEFVEEKKDE